MRVNRLYVDLKAAPHLRVFSHVLRPARSCLRGRIDLNSGANGAGSKLHAENCDLGAELCLATPTAPAVKVTAGSDADPSCRICPGSRLELTRQVLCVHKLRIRFPGRCKASGMKRECGRGRPNPGPQAAAAPATVSGECIVDVPLAMGWEGDGALRPASQETCRCRPHAIAADPQCGRGDPWRVEGALRVPPFLNRTPLSNEKFEGD